MQREPYRFGVRRGSSAFVVLIAFACQPGLMNGQATPPATAGASTPITAEQDHQRVMDQLQIKELRRPVVGDLTSPYAANYDESKANPNPKLPDPLLLNNGRKVTSAKVWWKQRRPEIVEGFDGEVYGRVPANVPKVAWQVTSTAPGTDGDIPVIVKQLTGHVDNSGYPAVSVEIQLTLTTPANAHGRVPVIMEITGGVSAPKPAPAKPLSAPPPGPPAGPSSQQQVLAKGWGYLVYHATTVQPDNGAGLSQGIIGLVDKGQPRSLDAWGALRAWAWGASRVLDYLETDTSVDAKQVGVEGHSRYGKAALVTMAYDQRFAIAYISSSGEGGSKLHRRNFGETVENVAATNEYYWMAGNFLKYAGPLHPYDLPVDSHELIALCAPRPVFVGSGATVGDGWADARGSFMSEVAAGPVYTLLGRKSLGTDRYPPIETALIDGDLGFRQHSGGHTPAPNWPTFLTFASRYLKAGS